MDYCCCEKKTYVKNNLLIKLTNLFKKFTETRSGYIHTKFKFMYIGIK